MEQHLHALLQVVHAEVVKGSAILGPAQFSILEPGSVQDVDGGARGFGAHWHLQRAIDEHDESIEGLLVETHDKVVQEGGATVTDVGEEKGARNGHAVALCGGRD